MEPTLLPTRLTEDMHFLRTYGLYCCWIGDRVSAEADFRATVTSLKAQRLMDWATKRAKVPALVQKSKISQKATYWFLDAEDLMRVLRQLFKRPSPKSAAKKLHKWVLGKHEIWTTNRPKSPVYCTEEHIRFLVRRIKERERISEAESHGMIMTDTLL